ncbi:unnamed protein product [Acanthocheilonema viteae]|uniref:Uncharacterized protein n=1 Tax=Acanthocheilonema viteae TaxID=6277 RepID=A0A498SEJ4_ACAVI|nr:unnamed protein product [Acanthocheilonema viteae]
MSEKGRDIRETKLEKPEKHVNKPIQAIKKLKNHFYKSSKKNKFKATSTALSIVRNVDATSKITDASRTADTPRSVISHSIESIHNAEPSQQTVVSRTVEPVQSHVISISSNNDKPIRNVDLSSPGIVVSRNTNLSRSTKVIRNGTVDFQTPNTSRNTIANISRNSNISRVTDTFGVNNLSRDMKMPHNEEMVYSNDLSCNTKEIGKNGELTGKNIDITDGKSLINGQKSSPEVTDQSSQLRTSQSLLISAENINAMKAELSEETKVEKLSDIAIEQQLASLNQRLKILIDENEKTNKREEQLFATKNQILAKIDIVKKQISEAMDHYRDIAHACHEKIEKEEIRQNEMLMDLKERIEKLDDMCTDINNQVDDMTATLNTAYNAGESDALYMIAACSYSTSLLTASNSMSPSATNKEKKIDTLISTPID